MTLEKFDDVLRHDRRTRSEWTEREWTDREMIIKMINIGWNITVH